MEEYGEDRAVKKNSFPWLFLRFWIRRKTHFFSFSLRFRREAFLDPFFRREAPKKNSGLVFLGAERRKTFVCIFFCFFYVVTFFSYGVEQLPFLSSFLFYGPGKKSFFTALGGEKVPEDPPSATLPRPTAPPDAN